MTPADDIVLAARMDALSRALDICAPLLLGEIVYLDYPVHGNVGDQLIWQGARAFLGRHRKRVIGQFSINNTGPRARRLLGRCTTIVMHGGGNLGDLYPRIQLFREGIIRAFPEKRIVIFPQTVHFDDARALARACDCLGTHPDLHILLRDEASFALLSDEQLPNLRVCPDMAHALWGALSAPAPTRGAPLHLLRRDSEAGELPCEIVTAAQRPVDWEDLRTGWAAIAFRLGVNLNHRDGLKFPLNRLPAYVAWNQVSTMLVERAIALFGMHHTIVTDRLHAMLLALLLRRRAVVCDNAFGKVSSYASFWLKDVPGIDPRYVTGGCSDDSAAERSARS